MAAVLTAPTATPVANACSSGVQAVKMSVDDNAAIIPSFLSCVIRSPFLCRDSITQLKP